MMRRAARFHTARGELLVAVLAAAVLAGVSVRGQVREQRQHDRAAALVRALETAETADVPKLLEEIGPYSRWANPLLWPGAIPDPGRAPARPGARRALCLPMPRLFSAPPPTDCHPTAASPTQSLTMATLLTAPEAGRRMGTARPSPLPPRLGSCRGPSPPVLK
jgi:hypothetical protein